MIRRSFLEDMNEDSEREEQYNNRDKRDCMMIAGDYLVGEQAIDKGNLSQ